MTVKYPFEETLASGVTVRYRAVPDKLILHFKTESIKLLTEEGILEPVAPSYTDENGVTIVNDKDSVYLEQMQGYFLKLYEKIIFVYVLSFYQPFITCELPPDESWTQFIPKERFGVVTSESTQSPITSEVLKQIPVAKKIALYLEYHGFTGQDGELFGKMLSISTEVNKRQPQNRFRG